MTNDDRPAQGQAQPQRCVSLSNNQCKKISVNEAFNKSSSIAYNILFPRMKTINDMLVRTRDTLIKGTTPYHRQHQKSDTGHNTVSIDNSSLTC